ncbi:hypothetical protein B5S33_g1901 [[Candida] boidinii]|nr:hypothetical protein B5S33_g1901 [[Candida] boidinii]
MLVNPPNRVLQIDAKNLDNEIDEIINKSISNLFNDKLSINSINLPSFLANLNNKFLNEFKLLVKLLIFKLTIWDKNSSYGLILQNLIYCDNKHINNNNKLKNNELSKIKKILLLSTVVLDYAFNKLESVIYNLDDDDNDENDYDEYDEDDYEDNETDLNEKNNNSKRLAIWKKKIIKKSLVTLKIILPKLTNIFKVLSFSNFIIFLINGRYPNLINRIFRLRYKPINSMDVSFASNPETISFEFQNRQLIWNTLTEFLVYILPIISLPKLKRNLNNFMYKSLGSSADSGDAETGNDSLKNTYKFLPERVCAICYENNVLKDTFSNVSSTTAAGGGNTVGSTATSIANINMDDNLITNPYETNCGHLYCYFCIVSTLEIQNELNQGTDSKDKTYWNCLRCNEMVEWCKVYDGDCNLFDIDIGDDSDSESESEASVDGEEDEEVEEEEEEEEDDEDEYDDDNDEDEIPTAHESNARRNEADIEDSDGADNGTDVDTDNRNSSNDEMYDYEEDDMDDMTMNM